MDALNSLDHSHKSAYPLAEPPPPTGHFFHSLFSLTATNFTCNYLDEFLAKG